MGIQITGEEVAYCVFIEEEKPVISQNIVDVAESGGNVIAGVHSIAGCDQMELSLQLLWSCLVDVPHLWQPHKKLR